MRVKRYYVDSMPDALQRIRSDLGKDAVILNTKQVRSGGFMGLFRKKQIEVIAAIDSLETNKKAVNSESVQIPTVKRESANSTSISSVKQQKAEAVDPTIVENLNEMKKMIYTLLNQKMDQGQSSGLFKTFEERLLNQGFSSSLVEHLMLQIIQNDQRPPEEWTEQELAIKLRQEILNMVTPERIAEISEHTKFVHFVGPTGVGKTTSIAKLAAEQVLKNHKKVGFITSDTFRIAAVEQLRTYASILNVPMEVVYSVKDLQKALEKLEECDLIFMDTAGRNFRNELYVSELNSLLQKGDHCETYLVLSLTMKYQDMKVVVDNFSKFKLDKILFTKLDETESYGSIFNVIHEYPFQLSYITNGQNVPNDIKKLNIHPLVDSVLGEVQDD